jgi:zinc-ribbon family
VAQREVGKRGENSEIMRQDVVTCGYASAERRATLLIIFGLRAFFRTIGQGVFHCPRCGGDRQYRLRSGRRYFTLFFLPVIPLTKLGDHVQCAACRSRFHPDVLGLPTAAQMSAALPAGMRCAAVAMLRASGPPGGPASPASPASQASPAARERALEAIRGAGASGYGPENLDADLAQPGGLDPTALAQVGAQLTTEAKEWFFAQAVRISLVDGPLSEAERQAARGVAQNLAMTPAQALGVITMTEQAARRD